ncbi:hypothetical protein [Moraxella catarrhalis]|uniref:hypothetical protein n=1 Tax=Moraxella catarrhalis TaxID=480 RepID=UPI0013D357E9|nr:hypothetical protein [Moraxella catarrhalis]
MSDISKLFERAELIDMSRPELDVNIQKDIDELVSLFKQAHDEDMREMADLQKLYMDNNLDWVSESEELESE